MTFIPFADPVKAAATTGYQYGSIAPFANTPGGIAQAAVTPGYGNAANNASLSYEAPVADQTGGTGIPGPTAQAIADYNTQRGTTMGSIDSNITDTANAYKGGILDYLDSRRQAQNKIDAKSVQNELAKEQGTQGVLDMVGQGIKSGGVVLANHNAGTSSAGDALAKAYGTLGRQQLSGVGNQFAQGQAGIAADQDSLVAGDATQIRHSQDKTGTINSIVNSATTALTSLNQAAATANVTDRVQIDAEIARIKQQALDALSAYDGELTGGIAKQGPLTNDAVRARANGLLTAGTAPETAFNYTTEVPQQFQNTGDFASSLPIFTNNKRQVTA